MLYNFRVRPKRGISKNLPDFFIFENYKLNNIIIFQITSYKYYNKTENIILLLNIQIIYNLKEEFYLIE